jgi:uncharacterized cofD-like protein
VWVSPETVAANTDALDAIRAADLVVLGPGSLYTSLLPPLLVRDVAAAIERSPAPVVLVANLMTEPGETDGYSLADHLAALHEHVPGLRIRAVVLNAAGLPPESVTRYAELGATPVTPDTAAVVRWGARPVFGDLLAPGEKIRHDPHNLAALVLALAGEERG